MTAILSLLFLVMADPNALCWDIYNPVPVDPNSRMMIELGSVVVYSNQAYHMPQDYLLLLSKNWLGEMPVAPRLIEGDTDMFMLCSPPRTRGTVKELAIWAKFYPGGLKSKPEPPPSKPTLLEAAMFMEMFMKETDR